MHVFISRSKKKKHGSVRECIVKYLGKRGAIKKGTGEEALIAKKKSLSTRHSGHQIKNVIF